MKTIIKQCADGIFLIADNKFDTTQGKVFINNHEITDIDTFFKVAEENTRLLEQVKKQKEVIDKTIEYIKENMYSYYDNNGEKYIEETIFERNANPKELLDILQNKEVSE